MFIGRNLIMGFMVKRSNNFDETMKEVKYLNEIGVTYFSGKKLGNMIIQVIVDESKNAYLVGTGSTNPNRDGGDYPIYYYSFCKDGLEYKIEVKKNDTGNVRNQNIEMNWNAKIICIPQGVNWNRKKSEICQLIEEAMRVDAYSSYGKRASKECFKSVCINVGEK